MTIDDAPMDGLDLAIRREAAVLHAQVDSTADTDAAWDDFCIARSATVITLADVAAARRRWRIAAAVGVAASLIAAVVIVRDVRGNDPTKPPTISPPSSTTTVVEPSESDYSALVRRRESGHQHLFAVAPEGTEHPFPEGPLEPEQASVFTASSAGWVAESGDASEGFWFFNLRDPETTLRFVNLAGWPGGHTSRGTWSPDGTMYASVELGTTAVVIDPATGAVTRLPSTTPPFSYPPTWTADGKGILAGPTPNTCFTGDEIDRSTLRIIPVDGGPETSTIPALAGAMNRIVFGPWMSDECGVPGEEGRQLVTSDVVLEDRAGKTTWIDSTDFEQGSLISNNLVASGRTLWVLVQRFEGVRVLDLYSVDAPHRTRLANTLEGAAAAGSSVSIAAVAPDESAVVVVVRHSQLDADYYLVPTDGSTPFLLDGDFVGFVPASLVDEPTTPTAPFSTLSLGTDAGLTAFGPGDTQRPIAGVPGSPTDSYVHLDVSAAGWVAETGTASNGFWFYDLRDPAGTRQFVDIPEAPGGRMSRGTWSPDGTLYATVEGGTTLAIVDPDTGVVTRLPSDHPPIGRQPTWTADGSGVLAGEPAAACGTTGDRALTIVPVDGGPELTSIPPLADGMNHVIASGLWSNDDLCSTNPPEAQPSVSAVTVVGIAGETTWLGETEVAPARLRQSVFGRTGLRLWVLAERDRFTRIVDLYEVTAPREEHMVNTLGTGVASESVISIVAVAPDDSGVVVSVNGPGDERESYFMPTDGSPPTLLDGEFAGFVPTSLIDELGS